MSSYLGRHADLYDLFYADKPYNREAEFVSKCLAECGVNRGGQILEFACGTGSHAFEFEKLGYQVTATDYSEDMIATAKRRAKEGASNVDFQLGDMRTLNSAAAPFDAVVCLFDSIGYVQSNEAVLEVFRNARRHLGDSGVLVFEFWHAAAMLKGYEPTRVRRWRTDDAEIVRISETTLNCETQLGEVRYTIHELHSDGRHGSIRETQVNRFFQVQEMALFLTTVGFQPLQWFAGFASDTNIDQDTWHVVAMARKCPESLREVSERE